MVSVSSSETLGEKWYSEFKENLISYSQLEKFGLQLLREPTVKCNTDPLAVFVSSFTSVMCLSGVMESIISRMTS